ncbi:hypothetical protein BO71DRAFT_436144 [Aspergillus ellipticus CBS 707.79]|uniref:Uncharacterized protein n=1 Tax=Aspergillus ellipticus CBS 707.79 TaxID=1448320 RepID=A0A319CRV9_9EURO|nr:hypothetical protein BO71DRAFT_436144 [Aspergillus ellipticus CBS 707.79]
MKLSFTLLTALAAATVLAATTYPDNPNRDVALSRVGGTEDSAAVATEPEGDEDPQEEAEEESDDEGDEEAEDYDESDDDDDDDEEENDDNDFNDYCPAFFFSKMALRIKYTKNNLITIKYTLPILTVLTTTTALAATTPSTNHNPNRDASLNRVGGSAALIRKAVARAVAAESSAAAATQLEEDEDPEEGAEEESEDDSDEESDDSDDSGSDDDIEEGQAISNGKGDYSAECISQDELESALESTLRSIIDKNKGDDPETEQGA